MISINSNSISSSIARNLNQNAADLQKITSQISSGKRILSAADDPAGSGILSSLKNQQASSNAVDKNLTSAQSLLGVADKALGTQQKILSQMKDLATQASSALLSTDQRSALQSSFGELQKQLDATVKNAKLFGQNLVDSTAADVGVQSGINAGDTYTLRAAKSDAATLKVDAATIDLSDTTKSSAAMTAIDAASGTVGANQSTIGTMMTGLSQISENNKNFQTNLTSSISRIEDADIPELSNQLAQAQAKQQLLSSTLGISNQMPSYLLNLIR